MAANPIITQQGLVVHQYHDTENLGARLPSAAGSAEAQVRYIAGMLRAYQVTRRADAREQGEAALIALLDYYFRSAEVPDTVTPTSSYTPTNYVAAKSPFNAAEIFYNDTFAFTAGVATLPAAQLHKVFSARSLDSVLAFENPYAPLLVGTSYPVASYSYNGSGGVTVTLVTPYTGSLICMYSTRTGPLIDRGSSFDDWPDWKTMAANQIVTSGELYQATYEAVSLANVIFGGDTWGKVAAAVRNQAKLVFGFADSSPYAGGIVPYRTNFGSSPVSLLGRRGPAYLGMQTPALMMSYGDPAGATKNLALLRAAQNAWKTLTGQPNTGPFAPVYHLDAANEGLIVYGTPGTFSWSGPDPLGTWGGFQYRPLEDILQLATRDGLDAAIRDEAVSIATEMIAWLAQDKIWHPMWADFSNDFARYVERACAVDWRPTSKSHFDQFAALVNRASALAMRASDIKDPMLSANRRYTAPMYGIPIDFPQRPPLGPPTDFPQGAAEINRPDPQMAAIILLAATRLDTMQRPNYDADGPMSIQLRAVVHKAMALLDVMWISEGDMAGTFSPDPANRIWYGAWHGEILDALSLTANWSRSGYANRPAIRSKVLTWINGMIDWAKNNSEVTPDAQRYPWPFSHNWRSDFTETFEYSTSVFSSFNGAEQRLSMRIEPRRRLSMMHTLKGDDARTYDAVLKAKQNQLLSVPQWHLAVRLTADVAVGQSYLLVDSLPAGRFTAGDYVGIGDGSTMQFGVIDSVVGLRVNLKTGLANAAAMGSKMLPTDSGLINVSTSASRRTTTVLEAQVTFDMAPQEDRRALPDIAPAMTFTVGTDTREVILRRPNRRDALNAGNTWEYNSTADYLNGPVRPINGQEKGRRTISGTWSLLNLGQINDYLGLVKRLHGRRIAAWLPSWTSDITPNRNSSFANRLYVIPNAHTDLGALLDPAVGVFIEMRDGTIHTARVIQLVPNEVDVMLRFDRDFATPVRVDQIKVFSLMYRVRQMSDTCALRWRSDEVAETTVSFISVFDEP